MADTKDGPATSKRIKISKTQQSLIIIVLATAIIVGACLVVTIHFIKNIEFNTRVIAAKEDAIANYEQTIKNVGICRDTNRDGKFTEDELRNCNPNNLSSESLTGTLRYNVMVDMANNSDLESVARESQASCYSSDGAKIDYQRLYDEAETEEQQDYYMAMIKSCSALRVIPDALPSGENEEALMSSLNDIFLVSGWEPEAISPSGEITESDIDGLESIPVSLGVEADDATTMRVIANIERSIRTFNMQTATISWSGTDKLTFQAQAAAYYVEPIGVTETSTTVRVDQSAAKKKSSTSK